MAQWHCVDHVHVNCHLYTSIPRLITTSQNATNDDLTRSQQLDSASKMTYIVLVGCTHSLTQQLENVIKYDRKCSFKSRLVYELGGLPGYGLCNYLNISYTGTRKSSFGHQAEQINVTTEYFTCVAT